MGAVTVVHTAVADEFPPPLPSMACIRGTQAALGTEDGTDTCRSGSLIEMLGAIWSAEGRGSRYGPRGMSSSAALLLANQPRCYRQSRAHWGEAP